MGWGSPVRHVQVTLLERHDEIRMDRVEDGEKEIDEKFGDCDLNVSGGSSKSRSGKFEVCQRLHVVWEEGTTKAAPPEHIMHQAAATPSGWERR